MANFFQKLVTIRMFPSRQKCVSAIAGLILSRSRYAKFKKVPEVAKFFVRIFRLRSSLYNPVRVGISEDSLKIG